MRKRRILVISTTDFLGGGESFIVNTLSRLPYELCFLVASKRLANDLLAEGQNEILLFKSKNFIRRITQINAIIKRGDFDTIIFNGGNSLFYPLLVRHHNKVMYKHTTYEAYTNIIKRFVAKWLIELNTSFSNRIIHVSNYSLRQQIFFPKKGVVVYHGLPLISTQHKTLSNGKHILLYVGRLDPAKGLPTIIEAARNLSDFNVELWIVGDGTMAEQIKNEMCPNIKYFGYRNNLAQFYEKADIFITLPKFEAFGLSILEALSFGLPVVATNVGGVPEMVTSNYNGLLIGPSVKSVITAVKKILSDKDFYEELSNNALSTAGKFHKSRTIAELENLL